MAVTIKTEGSQLTVISTEHTLATITDPGAYQLGVTLQPMADGDVITTRLKTKLTSGDTSYTAYDATVSHDQAAEQFYSTVVLSAIEVAATLQQSAGSAMTIIWAVFAA